MWHEKACIVEAHWGGRDSRRVARAPPPTPDSEPPPSILTEARQFRKRINDEHGHILAGYENC
jgi:hypothetical protein